MQLRNAFKVELDPDVTWSTIMDVPRIASCVPGAELNSCGSNEEYRGRVNVKLGPVALTFDGIVAVQDRNDGARTATIHGRGTDTKGRGNATSKTKVSVLPSGDGAEVCLDTDLLLSGMIAQYGRASGVIVAVSDELVAQFSGNLRNLIASSSGSGPPEQSPASAVGALDQAGDKAGPSPVLGMGFVWLALLRWLRGLI
ncbi:SRPBCC family protein [Bradyrhizobium sp. USDA 4449]